MQVMNRHAVIPLESRLQLVDALIRANVPYIEIGSFVNPRVVPAMSDTAELLRQMPAYEGEVACLVPNLRLTEFVGKLAGKIKELAPKKAEGAEKDSQ